MIDVEPQDGELRHFPLPPVLKRRLGYVALMYVGSMSLLLAIIWAEGANIVPWAIVAALPAVLAAYFARNASITVRVASDGSSPNATEIDAELAATASPFTPQIVRLLIVLAVVMAGTAFIVKQSARSDSPELVEARTACSASWIEFEQGETASTQRSWTECLLRNPSLASACGLGARLSSAMLGVGSIDDVRLDVSDLMACGDDIY